MNHNHSGFVLSIRYIKSKGIEFLKPLRHIEIYIIDIFYFNSIKNNLISFIDFLCFILYLVNGKTIINHLKQC